MTQPLLLAGGVFLFLLIGMGMVMLNQMQHQSRIAARIRRIHGEPVSNHSAAEPEALRIASLRAISGIGQMIVRRGLLSASTLTDLEQKLASSGLRGPNGVALFIGTKILLMAVLPLAALLLTQHLALPTILHMGLPVGAGVFGLVGPDFLVGRRRKRYLKRLERGLPDALDMMVICAQAGVGLGPAIVRVGSELHYAHPETAYEFSVTAQELQMLSDSPPPAQASAPAQALVQLTAATSESAAQAEWRRLQDRAPDAMTGREASIIRVERDGRTFWRLRTGGFADAGQATAFCERIHAAGGACVITR